MKIIILILNYNSYQDSIACLESVLKSTYTNFELVVVDNDSKDDSMNHLLNWAENTYLPYSYYESEKLVVDKNTSTQSLKRPITFIQTGVNLGFAGGNNVGLKYIMEHNNNYDAVWLLNPDTVILPDTLKKLVTYAQNQPAEVGIMGTALLYHHAPEKLQALGAAFNPFFATGRHILGHERYTSETMKHFKMEEVDMIIGASMLIRREVLEKVGLLEEKYFLYFEEIDYALRAKNAGYTLGLEPNAIVYHKEGASINKESAVQKVSGFSDFYAMRNRLLLTKKFHPWYLPTVIFGLLMSSVIRLTRGEYSKAWMIIQILFGKRKL